MKGSPMTAPSADLAGPMFVLSNPPGLYDPAPNGYSHVATLEPGARLVFISGQGGEDATGALPTEFEGQLRQALTNLVAALGGAGLGLQHVAKLTVLIVDHGQERLAAFGEELGERLGDAMAPTCTLIPVPRLALDGMLIEIEAVAVAPAQPAS